MFEQLISQKIVERKHSGLFRQRLVCEQSGSKIVIANKEYLNFSNNDYLGLSAEKLALQENYSGAKASPLVTGRQSIHLDLEDKILNWLCAPKTHQCLLMSSGYAANSAVISALFNDKNSNSILVQDKLNHASLMECGRNIHAKQYGKQHRFNHNDMEHLASTLDKRIEINCPSLIVTEGVFSMDGDSPDLTKLNQLAKKNNSWWMLDDAHGIGVNGENGSGTLSQQELGVTDCDILVITFGKAIGAQGAAIIVKNELADYLVNFSKEYIYSTHLSPLQCAAISHNIDKAVNEPWRREKLQTNIEYFKQQASLRQMNVCQSHSAIQGIIIGDETRAVEISDRLKEQGIWAAAMRYPTVAKGSARLRVTLTSSHNKQQLDQLFSSLDGLEL